MNCFSDRPLAKVRGCFAPNGAGVGGGCGAAGSELDRGWSQRPYGAFSAEQGRPRGRGAFPSDRIRQLARCGHGAPGSRFPRSPRDRRFGRSIGMASLAGDPLCDHSVAFVIKRAIVAGAVSGGASKEEAAAAAKKFAGHSLRSGLATSAAANRAPGHLIERQLAAASQKIRYHRGIHPRGGVAD